MRLTGGVNAQCGELLVYEDQGRAGKSPNIAVLGTGSATSSTIPAVPAGAPPGGVKRTPSSVLLADEPRARSGYRVARGIGRAERDVEDERRSDLPDEAQSPRAALDLSYTTDALWPTPNARRSNTINLTARPRGRPHPCPSACAHRGRCGLGQVVISEMPRDGALVNLFDRCAAGAATGVPNAPSTRLLARGRRPSRTVAVAVE
jgi:hypothetical protein